METEQKVDALKDELAGLRHSRAQVFQTPPIEWVQERVAQLREILERSPERSAVLLRNLLGPLCLAPTHGDIGRPYHTAQTSLNTLVLLEAPGEYTTHSEVGSNSLHWWARQGSNLDQPVMSRVCGSLDRNNKGGAEWLLPNRHQVGAALRTGPSAFYSGQTQRCEVGNLTPRRVVEIVAFQVAAN